MKRCNKIILVMLIIAVIPVCSAVDLSTSRYVTVDLLEYDTFSLEGFDDTRSISSSMHKYLGYATVFTGLLTGILSPEVVSEDLHKTLAITSSGLAAATMTFGFIAHIKDMEIDSGFDSNNIHAILGITGGVMMIAAPFTAPGEIHQVLGELGALTMGISIVGKLVF